MSTSQAELNAIEQTIEQLRKAKAKRMTLEQIPIDYLTYWLAQHNDSTSLIELRELTKGIFKELKHKPWNDESRNIRRQWNRRLAKIGYDDIYEFTKTRFQSWNNCAVGEGMGYWKGRLSGDDISEDKLLADLSANPKSNSLIERGIDAMRLIMHGHDDDEDEDEEE